LEDLTLKRQNGRAEFRLSGLAFHRQILQYGTPFAPQRGNPGQCGPVAY